MRGISPCRQFSAKCRAEKRGCTTWIEEETVPEEEEEEERELPLPATPFMFTSVQVRNEAVAGKKIKAMYVT